MPRRRSTEDIQLLRGALFVLRRKCGKPTCRCATASRTRLLLLLSGRGPHEDDHAYPRQSLGCARRTPALRDGQGRSRRLGRRWDHALQASLASARTGSRR